MSITSAHNGAAPARRQYDRHRIVPGGGHSLLFSKRGVEIVLRRGFVFAFVGEAS